MKHIPAVDSLRIVCAVFVVGLHLYGLPVHSLVDRLAIAHPGNESALQVVTVLNRALFDGGAAVIVFFIISGICIHWPVRSVELDVVPYLVRRYVRVGLPLLAAILIAQLAFGAMDFLDAVLWSLYCELIYYGLYPLLRIVALYVGWTALLVASFAAAALLAMQPDENHGYFFTYGHSLTWLLGLPTWLAGVWIAEQIDFTGTPLSQRALNLLRGIAWTLAAALIVLHDRRLFTMKWSLLLFVLPAGAWVVYEIRNAHHHGVNRKLEAAGAWSFSLYLCHKFSIALMARNGIYIGSLRGWSMALGLAIAISLAFYAVVERPSHRLARMLAQRSPRGWKVPPRDMAVAGRASPETS